MIRGAKREGFYQPNVAVLLQCSSPRFTEQHEVSAIIEKIGNGAQQRSRGSTVDSEVDRFPMPPTPLRAP